MGKLIGWNTVPNRSAWIALTIYSNGAKRYILAPDGLEAGQTVMSGDKAPVEVGNCLPLSEIPIGMAIHNLEIRPEQSTNGRVLAKQH